MGSSKSFPSSSELVQLKLNIETSVGNQPPPKQRTGVPLPLVEVGALRLDKGCVS